MTLKELERIIDKAADKAAEATMNKLKKAGRITYHNADSFRKTEELLILYPKLPEEHPERRRIDAALKVIADDDYFGVVGSRYFDRMTLEQIAEIYDCKVQNIGKHRNKLIRTLASELFPEDVCREIIGK